MARRRHGPGLEPVRLSLTKDYRALVKALQVLPEFDRIGLAVLVDAPFGTVSRVLSELENENYIEPTGNKVVYTRADLVSNPDLQEHRLNYASGKKPTASSVSYRKSGKWPLFIKRWADFLQLTGNAPVAGGTTQPAQLTLRGVA